MPNNVVNKKLNILKEQVKEKATTEVREVVLNESYNTFLDKIENITDAAYKKFEEKISEELLVHNDSILEGYTNRVIESFSKGIDNITNKYNVIKEELFESNQDKDNLTIALGEATGEIELLTERLNEIVEERDKEFERLQEEHSINLKKLNEAEVELRVFKLLDENIPLRKISKKLFECESLEELELMVKVLGEDYSNLKSLCEVNKFKVKGKVFLNEDIEEQNGEEKEVLSEEQKNDKKLAGIS